MDANEVQADQDGQAKTAKMSPAEYAAFTGSMSYPVGVAKAAIEAQEHAASQAADEDYVRNFMRSLEDPNTRLITEKPGEWTSHGIKGKAAILAALKRSKEQS